MSAAACRLGACVVALAASVAAARAQPATAPLLSLDAAIATARQQNRPLQAARMEVERAAEQVGAARALKKPLFDVRVSSGSLVAPLNFRFPVGAFGVFPAIGPVPPADTTITTNPRLTMVFIGSVTQPLTQLRRIGLGESAAERGRSVAEEQVRARDAEVTANVKKLYYGIVQAEAGLRAREESVELYRELGRVIQQYEAERAVLPAEGLSVRAGLLQQEHQFSSLAREALGYREQLNALLGRDLDEPFTVEPLRPASVEGYEMPAAEAQAVAARPELRISRLQAEQAELDLRATQAPGMPDVSVSFNYVGFYGFDLLPHHGAQLGVLATWQPWDWGRRRAERESKRIVHEQAGIAAREAEALVRVDVRARFRALQDAFELVRVSEAARDAARERLRVATERFGQNAILERELLEAQTGLAQSESACQQALAGYWTARAELERARADQ